MSTILIIALIVLLLIVVAGAAALQQRRRRDTRQARVEATARRTDAEKRLHAAEHERSIAQEQLERADRIDPDSG